MKTTNLLTILLAVLICQFISERAWSDTFGSGATAFDIEFVTIGNPGNVSDTTGSPNPAGSVANPYRIGKFEISEQMIDKANLEGNLAIMRSNLGPDKPVTSLSWNEAARFINWLNTSTGSTPAYKFALQPGEPGYSANADIQLWTISDVGFNPSNLFRNSLARYFLPNVDEWYKAAYYDAASGSYFDFPTGSNSAPAAVASGTAANTAVFNNQTGPADVTLAGGLSPYGTMGQGGNAREWQETESDLVNDSSSSPRITRGGNWVDGSTLLRSSVGTSLVPGSELFFVGFRVASFPVPEPNSINLVALSALTLSLRRKRR